MLKGLKIEAEHCNWSILHKQTGLTVHRPRGSLSCIAQALGLGVHYYNYIAYLSNISLS